MRAADHPYLVVLWVWCAFIAACLGQQTDASTNSLPTLTTVRQVRELSAKEASRGYPVRIQGVITCSEDAWLLWFLQDEAGDNIYLSNPQSPTPLNRGQAIEVEGQTSEGKFSNIIVNPRTKPINKSLIPRFTHPNYEQLDSGREDGNLVQIEGRIRSLTMMKNCANLSIWMGSNVVQCALIHTPSSNLDHLLDAQVRVTAICAVYSSNRKMTGFRLFIPAFEQIVVVNASREDPWATPITHFAALARMNASESGRRIHVVGRVMDRQRDVSVTLQDDTGTTLLNTPQFMDAQNGDVLEALGFPVQGNEGMILQDIQCRPVKSTNGVMVKLPNATLPNPKPPLLTRIDQIRRLPPEEYHRSYPVQIEGVITVCDPIWKLLFIEDDSGGIYVYESIPQPELKAGQKVRVKGFTAPGMFSPIVSDPGIEILGPGEWPVARTITYAQAITGHEDAQWTEIIGVVHQVRHENGHTEIILTSQGEHFRALILNPDGTNLPTHLIDARVAIVGVCATIFNDNKQIVGIMFHLPDVGHIRILDAAPENPFAGPVQPINRLMRFNPGNGPEQRIHVQGIVTLRLNQDSIYVQDETDGILVTGMDKTDVRVGDKVDAVGFVSLGQYQPRMDESLIRKIGPGTIPKAVDLDFNQALKGDYDGRRVTIDGSLLLSQAGGTLLSLDNNGHLFEVRMIGEKSGRAAADLLPQSTLQITGVCNILANEFREPTGVCILADSTEGIVLLERPPWWTNRHMLEVTASLIVAILATTGWVMLLRRRVARQTDQIRLHYEKAAVLERRFRAFVETANDAIIMTDAKTGLVLNINHKAELLLGLPADEVVGKPCLICHPPGKAEHYEQLLERLKTPGNLVTSAELYSFSDKRSIPVEVSATTIEHQGQTIIQGIYRDMSERLRMESELRHAQKMQSVGQLAAGIAHDFNNLLTVIQGHSSLLLAQNNLDSNAMESANEIKDATCRATDLTRQLLVFSRKQMLQPQPVNLNAIIDGMAKMFRRMLGENIQLHCVCSPASPRVFADPGMMEQVFMNLVVNARDAMPMPKGGELTITTDQVEIGPAQCKDRPEARIGQFAHITFADNGCGMDAATLTRIFEPFFTTKEVGKGTGLGLATVYGIVNQHNGWIEVQSQPDQGTTFQIFIPLIDKNLSSDKQALKPMNQGQSISNLGGVSDSGRAQSFRQQCAGNVA